MLSSKNRQEYKQKYGDKKQRYSIHRVGLVTASVLVGLVFSGMNGKAHADTIATTTTVHENNTTDVVATNAGLVGVVLTALGLVGLSGAQRRKNN